MTTTTQGANAARETGMARVSWTEHHGAGGIHGTAHVGGATCTTLRTLNADTRVFWRVEARQYDGDGVSVSVGGFCPSLEEARAAAEGRAWWAAWALKRALETRACVDCDESTSVYDLTGDGRCEACVAACACAHCAHCGDAIEPSDEPVDDPTCETCAADEDDEDDGCCSTCAGTGIGQSGDPDTSRCHDCGGGGARRYRMDPADAADAAYDRAREGDW